MDDIELLTIDELIQSLLKSTNAELERMERYRGDQRTNLHRTLDRASEHRPRNSDQLVASLGEHVGSGTLVRLHVTEHRDPMAFGQLVNKMEDPACEAPIRRER